MKNTDEFSLDCSSVDQNEIADVDWKHINVKMVNENTRFFIDKILGIDKEIK